MAVPPAKSSPRDAQVMSAILKDMGVTEHEPRLINQMLEFTYRYVTDILDDAKVYSNHANKKAIDVEDVQLAVQCRMDHSFTSPPPRDLLMEIARHKNGQSLPLIKPYTGPRLPPDRYCLSAPNYKLVSSRKKAHRIQIGLPMNPLGGGHRISLTPLPKQHSSKVQISTPTPRPPGMSLSSMTVINRPPTVKPVVRVATQGAPTLIPSVPNSQLGGMPHMSGPPIMGGATSQVLTPQGMAATQPMVSVTGIVTPQKRKREDDDYDQT